MSTKLNSRRLNHLLCLLLCLCLSSITSAQNNSKNKSIWVTGNFNLLVNSIADTQFEIFSTEESTTQFSESIQAINLGGGVRIENKENWFHEISITSLNISFGDEVNVVETISPQFVEPSSGRTRKRVFVYLRWEYGKWFEFARLDKSQLGLSLSADPFVNHRKFLTVTSA